MLNRESVSEVYVAFVDILGFSSQVTRNFNDVLETYNSLLNDSDIVRDLAAGVSLSIYSDSFLLKCASLAPLIRATQLLHMHTLMWNCLVRGGLSFGKHIEQAAPPDFHMVSEAVVRAVNIEKTVSHPCVAIDPGVTLPDEAWTRFGRNVERGVLYFGGLRLVNPFNIGWGTSAATRVRGMLDEYPEHRGKFEWFLELHRAVFSPVPMVPPQYFTDAS